MGSPLPAGGAPERLTRAHAHTRTRARTRAGAGAHAQARAGAGARTHARVRRSTQGPPDPGSDVTGILDP